MAGTERFSEFIVRMEIWKLVGINKGLFKTKLAEILV